MTGHTPGPWEWWTVGIEEEVMLLPKGREKTTGDAVLTLGWVSCGDGTCGKEPSPEDARLIAAAPELLEALRECHKVLGTYVKKDRKHNADFAACSKAWSAVMKATGESR